MVVARRVHAVQRRRRRAVAALAVPLLTLSLVAASCSENEPQGKGNETTTSGGGSQMSEAEATKWLLDYTGGPGGEAKGEPYRIGFAHSNDAFPEGNQAAKAAIELINTKLGGVGGRPLELVTCNIAAPPDGARCGAQFANDDAIDLVVSGLVLAGNADLYAALGGKAAALMATPLDASDYVSPHAVAYNPGALGAGMGGAVFVNEDLKPKSQALVVTDDVAGRGGASVLTPIAEQAGVKLQTVFVPPTATAPEIASALQATGAQNADLVSLGLFEQGCIAAYDALRSLGLNPTVVTTSVCTGNAMQDHLAELGEGQAPEGWYFVGGSLLSENLPDGPAAYMAMAKPLGYADVAQSVASPVVFGVIMDAAKHINSVGVDKASFETLDAAVRGFKGPDMFQPGPLDCGIPPYISICGVQINVSRYLHGKWEAVRSAQGGNPVDITRYLRPGS